MAKKKKSKAERERRRVERERIDLDDLAGETARIYTCSTSVADDFSGKCLGHRDDIEVDLLYDYLAYDFWKDRAGLSKEIATALADYIKERQRQRQALDDFRVRFAGLAKASETSENHEHLDPLEDFKARVRERLDIVDTSTVINAPV